MLFRSGNQPFIFGDRNDLNPNSIQALVTGAPYVADKLYELKQNIWNEVLTFLGVPNVQMNKKERLITDEVNRGLGGVFASRYSGLLSRRQACDQINEMFGLYLLLLLSRNPFRIHFCIRQTNSTRTFH